MTLKKECETCMSERAQSRLFGCASTVFASGWPSVREVMTYLREKLMINGLHQVFVSVSPPYSHASNGAEITLQHVRGSCHTLRIQLESRSGQSVSNESSVVRRAAWYTPALPLGQAIAQSLNGYSCADTANPCWNLANVCRFATKTPRRNIVPHVALLHCGVAVILKRTIARITAKRAVRRVPEEQRWTDLDGVPFP